MGRRPCCSKVGLNRGSWSAREDMILTNYVLAHGEGKWRDLPRRAGLKRCGKSCRLRWLNYLRPDIKRGNITKEEEELIIRLHNLLGNRWSLIAGRLPGRTDNEIKNYWNTNLSKRLNGTNMKSTTPSSTPETTTPKPSKKRPTRLSRHPPVTSSLHQNPIVVRTKAVRCTGIYAIQNDVLLQKNQQSKINPSKNYPFPTEPSDDDNDPLGLFMGIMNMDDFMSEIQGSDLLRECCAQDAENTRDQIDQDGNVSSINGGCPDSMLSSEDEALMEEWKDCLKQPNVDSDDFKDLISFLDQ